MQFNSWDRQGFYSSPTPALPQVPPALISRDPTTLFLTVPKESHFSTQTFLLELLEDSVLNVEIVEVNVTHSYTSP
jgi:hypothetical protein